MRKLIVAGLMAATMLPAAASAQSRGELRRDRQDLRHEREDLRDARMRGDRNDVRDERQDVREARQELRGDRQDRRAHRRGYVQYRAPVRGWTYQTVTTGYQLQPTFYNQRYYAPGYRSQGVSRWIRYGDDLVLVNTRTGRVVQVRRDYFW